MTAENIIKGLIIIDNAKPEGESGYHVRAEHDFIYAGSLDWNISDEDKSELDNLGWEPDEDVDGWRAMV